MKTKLITYSLGVALVIAVASPIFAQEDKTEIPPAITIPDMLLTHLGTIKFAEAFPKRVLAMRNGTRSLFQRKSCGAYGIRTRDLLNAIEALYQLS